MSAHCGHTPAGKKSTYCTQCGTVIDPWARLAEVEAVQEEFAVIMREHYLARVAAEARVQELEAIVANVHVDLSLGDDAILHDSDVIDRIMRITGYTRTTP